MSAASAPSEGVGGLEKYRTKARGWGNAARQGESKQRYSPADCCDGGAKRARLVAGCVPFRRTKDGSVEFLLLSSVKHADTWIFPKGGWEMDESCPEAAERETFEEAGVVGDIVGVSGGFQAEGGGGGGTEDKGAAATPVHVETYKNGTRKLYMFLLRVELELDDFPEKHRARRWVSFAEALRALRVSKAGANGPLARALIAAAPRVGLEVEN